MLVLNKNIPSYLILTYLVIWRLNNWPYSDLLFRLIAKVTPFVYIIKSMPKWNPVHLQTCLSFTLSTLPHLRLLCKKNSSSILIGLKKLKWSISCKFLGKNDNIAQRCLFFTVYLWTDNQNVGWFEFWIDVFCRENQR